MNKLTENSSANLTYKAILYLRGQLVSRIEQEDRSNLDFLKQLTAECEEQLNQVREAQDRLLTAQANRMGINGELKLAASESYQTLIQIAREIRTLLKGDQSNPLYQKLFPKSPSQIGNPSLGYMQHLTFANSVKEKLRSDPDYERLSPYVTELDEKISKTQDLILRRSRFLNDENDAAVHLNQILQSAKSFYNHSYTRLLMIYQSDQKIVDPFFYKISHRKKKQQPNPANNQEANQQERNASF